MNVSAYPTRGISYDIVGGNKAWANADRITAVDRRYSTATFTGVEFSALTEWLCGYTFGFAIPSDATITGVSATYRRSASSSVPCNIIDSAIFLCSPYTNPLHIAGKTAVGAWSERGDRDDTVGADGDLWGAILTPAIVNSSDFGVRLRAERTGTGGIIASVDAVSMTIYYTEAPVYADGCMDLVIPVGG